MIDFLSHLHLLIAIAPMAAVGFLVGLGGLIYIHFERRASERARRRTAQPEARDTHLDKPKTAHA